MSTYWRSDVPSVPGGERAWRGALGGRGAGAGGVDAAAATARAVLRLVAFDHLQANVDFMLMGIRRYNP